MRARILTLAALAALSALPGCAHRRPAASTGGEAAPGSRPNTVPGTARVAAVPDETHVPPFARKPYEPFSRAEAVAVALREWRLFGQKVNDDPPGSHPEPLPDDKPERQAGLWQRVGEYWFEGLDASAKENAWTGKHDEYGLQFPADQDAHYAWSAAFISYVMRIAGAGARFPYSSVHADYINMAREMSTPGAPGAPGLWAVSAQPTDTAVPAPGDLICTSRATKVPLRFEDLPTPTTFPSHCDMVVDAAPGMLSVLGGNVDDAVTMKHVPVTAAGTLSAPGGTPVDGRYNWFVVLKVVYDR